MDLLSSSTGRLTRVDIFFLFLFRLFFKHLVCGQWRGRKQKWKLERSITVCFFGSFKNMINAVWIGLDWIDWCDCLLLFPAHLIALISDLPLAL